MNKNANPNWFKWLDEIQTFTQFLTNALGKILATISLVFLVSFVLGIYQAAKAHDVSISVIIEILLTEETHFTSFLFMSLGLLLVLYLSLRWLNERLKNAARNK